MEESLRLEKNKKPVLLLLLLTIAIIAPLNNDIFISSLPSINRIFKTGHAQWILSVALISIAFAQIFSGAFMDKFGRKPVIIGGLMLFSLSSVGVLLSDYFNLLLVFRVLQSIGASCSIVGAVAIAKDSVRKENLVHYTSFIFGIVSISPFLAPTIGSYLQTFFGWKGSFSFLLVAGIMYFAIFLFFFKESIKKRDETKIGKVIFGYSELLNNRKYIYYTSVNCMSYIIIFSFIATSPIIIMHKFGFSALDFGHIFLLFSVMLLAMNVIAPKIASRTGLDRLLYLGGGFMVLGMSLLLLLNLFNNSLLSFIVPMMIAGIGCGIIRPIASAAVMRLFSAKIAGKTIGLYNFMFYLASGVATLFSNMLIYGSPRFARV